MTSRMVPNMRLSRCRIHEATLQYTTVVHTNITAFDESNGNDVGVSATPLWLIIAGRQALLCFASLRMHPRSAQ
jgi:hypothetical protein